MIADGSTTITVITTSTTMNTIINYYIIYILLRRRLFWSSLTVLFRDPKKVLTRKLIPAFLAFALILDKDAFSFFFILARRARATEALFCPRAARLICCLRYVPDFWDLFRDLTAAFFLRRSSLMFIYC